MGTVSSAGWYQLRQYGLVIAFIQMKANFLLDRTDVTEMYDNYKIESNNNSWKWNSVTGIGDLISHRPIKVA